MTVLAGDFTNNEGSGCRSGADNLEGKSYELLAALNVNISIICLSNDLDRAALSGNGLLRIAIINEGLLNCHLNYIELRALIELCAYILNYFGIEYERNLDAPNVNAVEGSEIKSYGDDRALSSLTGVSSVNGAGDENLKSFILHGSSLALVAACCARTLALLVTILSVVNFNIDRISVVILVDTLDVGNCTDSAILAVLDGVALVYAGSGNYFGSGVVMLDSNSLLTNYANTILNICIGALGGQGLTCSIYMSAAGYVIGKVLMIAEGAIHVIEGYLIVISIACRCGKSGDGGVTGLGIGMVELGICKSLLVGVIALYSAVSLDSKSLAIKSYGLLLAFENFGLGKELNNNKLIGSCVAIVAISLELLAVGAVSYVYNTVDLTGCLVAYIDVLPSMCIGGNGIGCSSLVISKGYMALGALIVVNLGAVSVLDGECRAVLVDNGSGESGLLAILGGKGLIAESTDIMRNDTGFCAGCSLAFNMLAGDMIGSAYCYVNILTAAGAKIYIISSDRAVACERERIILNKGMTATINISYLTLCVRCLELDTMAELSLIKAGEHHGVIDNINIGKCNIRRALCALDNGTKLVCSERILCYAVTELGLESHIVSGCRSLIKNEVQTTIVIALPYIDSSLLTSTVGKILRVIDLFAVQKNIRLVIIVLGNGYLGNDVIVYNLIFGLGNAVLSIARAIFVATKSVNTALRSTGSSYLKGNGLVSGRIGLIDPVFTASSAKEIFVAPCSTGSFNSTGRFYICIRVLILGNCLFAGSAGVGICAAYGLLGASLNGMTLDRIKLSVVNLGDLLVVILANELEELTTIVTLVDSIVTYLGAGVFNSSLNKGETLHKVVLALNIKDLNGLGVLALLAGEESGSGNILAVGPLGLGKNLGELPIVRIGLLLVTNGALINGGAAVAGDLNPLVAELNGIVLSLTARSTLLVYLAVSFLGAISFGLGMVLIGSINPFMTCRLGSKVISKLLAALLARIESVRRISAGCINLANFCVFTVLDSVYIRAALIIGNSRKYGRRYERHYHDRCQNKRKNLFHVFFLSKMYFLEPSCHASDGRPCHKLTAAPPSPPHTKRQLIYFGIA